ncbi:hypothetical protein DENSPDRAFT_853747 [Dentipellis sp. KUC8613]|nr:hypothetical protein DENSPDRAFT_853747 [Dentipellis sp. KUC8613]
MNTLESEPMWLKSWETIPRSSKKVEDVDSANCSGDEGAVTVKSGLEGLELVGEVGGSGEAGRNIKDSESICETSQPLEQCVRQCIDNGQETYISTSCGLKLWAGHFGEFAEQYSIQAQDSQGYTGITMQEGQLHLTARANDATWSSAMRIWPIPLLARAAKGEKEVQKMHNVDNYPRERDRMPCWRGGEENMACWNGGRRMAESEGMMGKGEGRDAVLARREEGNMACWNGGRRTAELEGMMGRMSTTHEICGMRKEYSNVCIRALARGGDATSQHKNLQITAAHSAALDDIARETDETRVEGGTSEAMRTRVVPRKLRRSLSCTAGGHEIGSIVLNLGPAIPPSRTRSCLNAVATSSILCSCSLHAKSRPAHHSIHTANPRTLCIFNAYSLRPATTACLLCTVAATLTQSLHWARFAFRLLCLPRIMQTATPPTTSRRTDRLFPYTYSAWSQGWEPFCVVVAANTQYIPQPIDASLVPTVQTDGLWGVHEWTRFPQPYVDSCPFLAYIPLPQSPDNVLSCTITRSMWTEVPGMSGYHTIANTFRDQLREELHSAMRLCESSFPKLRAMTSYRHIDLPQITLDRAATSYYRLCGELRPWHDFVEYFRNTQQYLLELRGFRAWKHVPLQPRSTRCCIQAWSGLNSASEKHTKEIWLYLPHIKYIEYFEDAVCGRSPREDALNPTPEYEAKLDASHRKGKQMDALCERALKDGRDPAPPDVCNAANRLSRVNWMKIRKDPPPRLFAVPPIHLFQGLKSTEKQAIFFQNILILHDELHERVGREGCSDLNTATWRDVLSHMYWKQQWPREVLFDASHFWKYGGKLFFGKVNDAVISGDQRWINKLPCGCPIPDDVTLLNAEVRHHLLFHMNWLLALHKYNDMACWQAQYCGAPAPDALNGIGCVPFGEIWGSDPYGGPPLPYAVENWVDRREWASKLQLAMEGWKGFDSAETTDGHLLSKICFSELVHLDYVSYEQQLLGFWIQSFIEILGYIPASMLPPTTLVPLCNAHPDYSCYPQVTLKPTGNDPQHASTQGVWADGRISAADGSSMTAPASVCAVPSSTGTRAWRGDEGTDGAGGVPESAREHVEGAKQSASIEHAPAHAHGHRMEEGASRGLRARTSRADRRRRREKGAEGAWVKSDAPAVAVPDILCSPPYLHDNGLVGFCEACVVVRMTGGRGSGVELGSRACCG